MEATTTDPSAAPDRDEPSRPRVTVTKVLLALAILAIAAMWIYGFSPWARRTAPDALEDRTAMPQAELLCAQARADLAALPAAGETATPAERADVVVRTNVVLRQMTDDLARVPIHGERDQRIYAEWLADWRTYIGDRDDYANRLRTDRDARIFVTKKGPKQITEPIKGFAQSNLMASCAPPGDLF